MTGWLVVSSNYKYHLGVGVVVCELRIGVKDALSLLLLVARRQQIVLWLVPPQPCHLPHTILLLIRPRHYHPQGWQVWQDQEIWRALGALENS